MKLDVGCGPAKAEGYVGIDYMPGPNVDIVYDATCPPWPVELECPLAGSDRRGVVAGDESGAVRVRGISAVQADGHGGKSLRHGGL